MRSHLAVWKVVATYRPPNEKILGAGTDSDFFELDRLFRYLAFLLPPLQRSSFCCQAAIDVGEGGGFLLLSTRFNLFVGVRAGERRMIKRRAILHSHSLCL